MDPARRLAVAPAVPDARAQRSTCSTSASCGDICVIHHRERTLVLAGGPAAAAAAAARAAAGGRAGGEHRAATTSVALRLPRGAHGPATNSWGSHDTCLPGIRYQTLRLCPPGEDLVPRSRARASCAASWSRGGGRLCRKSATSARVRVRVKVRARVRARARVKAGLGPRLG